MGCEARLTRRLGRVVQFFYAASEGRHYRMRAVFFAAELTGTPDPVVGLGEPLFWLPRDEAQRLLFHSCHAWALEVAADVSRAAVLIEHTAWEGRGLTVTWDPTPVLPPPGRVTQASGVCFTEDGRIVLVRGSGGWSLPGGHPEPGETAVEALTREVREEACAVVDRSAYLGAQRVEDPGGGEPYFQTRWWARVTLLPFQPLHEKTERTLVSPEQFVDTLNWDTRRIAGAILDAALDTEDWA